MVIIFVHIVNLTVPEKINMSTYKKHVIKCLSVDFCIFLFSVRSPNVQLTFIDRCVHVFSYPSFFLLHMGT